MVMFLMFGIFVAILVGTYAYRVIRRVMKFYGADFEKKKTRIMHRALTAITMLCCVIMWSMSAIIVLHLVVISGVLDILALIGRLIAKIFRRNTSNAEQSSKNKITGKVSKAVSIIYGSFAIPAILTVILCTYGYFNMNHVVETDYVVESEKVNEPFRVLLITDTHYSGVQDKQVLKDTLPELDKVDADIVVLGGDIVEEATSKDEMKEVFEMLGKIKSKYGVYYVYGNHDRQPYTTSRTYTDEELAEGITAANITILQDDIVDITSEIALVGREGAAWGNVSDRKTAEELLEDVDKDKFIIVADHQPVEAKENAALGVDLEISGHTHAGQIWPAGILNQLSGVLNYGDYDIDGCEVIVSSGVAGWGYPIRTGEHCEYVVIDVK